MRWPSRAVALLAGVSLLTAVHDGAAADTAPASPTTGEPWRLMDAGESLERPRALVVITPGLAPACFKTDSRR